MILFQLGMFSFWGTVAFAPILFIRDDESSVTARRSILRFYIPYFGQNCPANDSVGRLKMLFVNGFLANRYRGNNLALCRRLLGIAQPVPNDDPATDVPPTANTTVSEPVPPCPACKTGKLLRIESLPAVRLTVIPLPHWPPPTSRITTPASCFGSPSSHTTPGTNTS